MTRRRARIGQDEVARMVKAVRHCGLPIASVEFDGERVRVIIGESGDKPQDAVDTGGGDTAPIREPQV